MKNVGVKKKKGHTRSFLAAQLIRLTGSSDAAEKYLLAVLEVAR